MRTRILPGTDLSISEVCLGTMTWGEQNSERDAHAQLDRAIDLGINFIDTRRDVSGAAARGNAGAHRDLPRQLAGGARSAAPRRGHESRRTGAARLDPRRSHRSHPRRHRRGLRHQPRTASRRLHRPVPDPLAAAQRAAVRRQAVRPGAGTRRARHCRAGRGDGSASARGQDPLLGPVQRDGMGCRCVQPDGARARRAGPGHRAERLQPGVARRGVRARRDPVPGARVAPRVQSARRRHAHRQVPGRRAARRRPLHRVLEFHRSLRHAARARGRRRVRGTGAATRHPARCSSRSVTCGAAGSSRRRSSA